MVVPLIVTSVIHRSYPHETDSDLVCNEIMFFVVRAGMELPFPDFKVYGMFRADGKRGEPAFKGDLIRSAIHTGCTLMCEPDEQDPYSFEKIVSVLPASRL